MSCGVGCRRGSNLAWLWLWCRLVVARKKNKKQHKRVKVPAVVQQDQWRLRSTQTQV